MRRAAALPVLAVLLIAGCTGGDSEPEQTPIESIVPDEPDDDAAESDDDADLADDLAAEGASACDLISFQSLGKVFGVAMPEPEANEYGAGFSECVWEDGDKQLRISVVPAANLQTDYVDQLNTQQMAGFDEGIGFPGMVGIGHASSGGTTVGFTHGDDGVLIGVNTAGASNDGTIAVELAQEVLGG